MVVKHLGIAKITGLLALLGLGTVMVLTNPGQTPYEEFAVQKLSEYGKTQVCNTLPNVLGNSLREQCSTMVDTTRPHLKPLIGNNTKRQNFLLFSLYQTDLAIGPMIPTYHFETIGVFQTFFVVKAEKR